MKKWFAILLLSLGTATAALALEDTPQNREQQVDRYLNAVPMQELMQQMANSMANTAPMMQQKIIDQVAPNATPEQRQVVEDVLADKAKLQEKMLKNIDLNTIRKIQREVLVATLTADELSAMADFYLSPVGKSAMSKMGAYTQELMPLMIPEIIKAVVASRAEMGQGPK
jgi:hypothetical protein